LRSLAALLLGPSALGQATSTPDDLRREVRGAAGPRGSLETFETDGDPRDPARLFTLFATPGRPASRPTILFVHGKGGCGAEFRPDAARAVKLGYNILVTELRAHPPSTGTRITYGLFEKVDIELVLADARRRYGIDRDRIGIDSCSMGTLVALQVASSMPALRALWLHSPFGNLREMAVQYLHRATSLPASLLVLPAYAAICQIEATTGFDLSAVDPIRAARKVTCPTTVVHGEADVLVPISFAPPVFEALAGEKEFWRVPRAGHCHHPDEPQALYGVAYRERWTAFFRRHLPVRSAA
jgi:pimeloyl-ACP methyl ester carboxylesterase